MASNGNQGTNTARNAVISGIVALILSPVATFITITTTSSLLNQKADLTIASIDAEAISSPLNIKYEDRIVLNRTSDIIQTIIERTGDSPSYNECFAGVIRGVIRNDCIDDVKRDVNQIIKTIGNEKSVVNDAKKEKTMASVMTVIGKTSIIPDVIDRYIYWSDYDKRPIDTIMSPYAEQLDKLYNVLGSVREILANWTPKRSGLVIIKVGILNRGGTDSVVFTDAILNFSGQSVRLRPYDADIPSGVVVKARSFNTVTLAIDEQKTPAASTRDWKTIVLQKINQEFSVYIKTVDGENIVSTARLPLNEISEDELIKDRKMNYYTMWPTRITK